MNTPLKVVIGIATAGRRDQMRLTLAEIARQRTLPARVVICPAEPDDCDAQAAQAALACPVSLVHGPRGLTAQRNTILAACDDADVLIFLDDDFYPAHDYVEQVTHLFATQPELVVATNQPLLDGATGPGIPPDEATRIIDALAPWETTQQPLRPTYGGYGCNMSIRMAPVRQHGLGFDETLPLYGWLEDIDFTRRIAPHGRIANCASLRGVHLATKRGRNSGLRFGYSQVANPVYLLRKGSMSLSYALRQMGRNLAKNIARSPWPEPWVDRRGRLKGNLLAFRDLLRGSLDPRRISELK